MDLGMDWFIQYQKYVIEWDIMPLTVRQYYKVNMNAYPFWYDLYFIFPHDFKLKQTNQIKMRNIPFSKPENSE